MKVGIIGAGFTGLAAAYALQLQGHTVTLYEKDSQPGGLAIGYQEPGWEWSLEKHYHHWFTNDTYILRLAKAINHPVLIRRPKTSVYVQQSIHQLDSPSTVLTFPHLTLAERLRMAAILGLLRYNPYWKPLERVHAGKVLQKVMGENAYQLLWQPQFQNKFGKYVDEVSLAWFWARITKRTPSLAYPEGGFLQFADHLVQVIKNNGGTLLFDTEVLTVDDTQKVTITSQQGKETPQSQQFDQVLVTLPSFLFTKIAPQLPDNYKQRLAKLKGLGATNLVLRLKKPFFADNTYWLSVCDTTAPVLAIVEHTNFMDKEHYDGEHLLYLGNYVPTDHPYFSMHEEEMLNKFDPFLSTINASYRKNIIGMKLFKAPFAQPIVPVNYSKLMPAMRTPLPHVLLANIEQVYPWDRGTNYAVELGEKAAMLISKNTA